MTTPRLVLTLISPLAYLRERGYRIERAPDDLDWWRLVPPAGSALKERHRCGRARIARIARVEGWEPQTMQSLREKAKRHLS